MKKGGRDATLSLPVVHTCFFSVELPPHTTMNQVDKDLDGMFVYFMHCSLHVHVLRMPTSCRVVAITCAALLAAIHIPCSQLSS